jgi:tRNA (guanine-N7-)-methyltransferase
LNCRFVVSEVRAVQAKRSNEKPNASRPRQRLIFGRRKGHKLRARQAALLERRLPDLTVDLPAKGRLDPAKSFGLSADTPVWLEVGFGGGEHLIAQALAHEAVFMIGCEPFLNGIAKLVSAIDRHKLTNIRIYPDDARDLMDALPDGVLSRVFVLFPDPWPKARHAKRRFISGARLTQLHRIMAPGAELRIASDIPLYVAWTLMHIRAHGGFLWQAECADDWRNRPDDWPETRYEKKALEAGRTASYLRFLRS